MMRTGMMAGVAAAVALALSAQPAAAANPAATILSATLNDFAFNVLNGTAPTQTPPAMGYSPPVPGNQGPRAATAEGGWIEISRTVPDPRSRGFVIRISADMNEAAVRAVVMKFARAQQFTLEPANPELTKGTPHDIVMAWTLARGTGTIHLLHRAHPIFQRNPGIPPTAADPADPSDGVDTVMIWHEMGAAPAAPKR